MISVLTPTYNRAYTLERLYLSLVEQTSYDFEWIIIDDGSGDCTKELVEKWDNSLFSINYFYKKNEGKHTAINFGVEMAKGEYIFIVDSDDYLLPEAIKCIHRWVDAIKNDQRFAGVSGLCGYTEKKEIGERPRGQYVDCTNLERKNYSLRGDKAEVYKRDILLKYPFPVFEGERFLPEDIVWNAIARDGYLLRWYNEIIYIAAYLPDGLTMSGRKEDRRIDNFWGYTAREQLNVKVQSGIEKYMELGRYIDLVKKKKIADNQTDWIRGTLNISLKEYVYGYVCYVIRKYGKTVRRVLHGQ